VSNTPVAEVQAPSSNGNAHPEPVAPLTPQPVLQQATPQPVMAGSGGARFYSPLVKNIARLTEE